MNSTAFDVADLLNSSTLFGDLGTDIFSDEWGNVDKQIAVIEGVGVPSELKDLYEQPGIQILVRGEKKKPANDTYLIAKAVSDFLLSQSENTIINGETYKGFEPSSNIAAMGKDENERFAYSMNFFTYRDAN